MEDLTTKAEEGTWVGGDPELSPTKMVEVSPDLPLGKSNESANILSSPASKWCFDMSI